MDESLHTDSEDHVTDMSMQLADTSTSNITSNIATFPTARMVVPIIPGTNPFEHMSTSTIANAWNHASTSSSNNAGFMPEFSSFNYMLQEQPLGGQFLSQNSARFECQRPHVHVGNGNGNGNGNGGGILQDSMFSYDFNDHAGVDESTFPNNPGMGSMDSFNGYGQNPFS